MDHFDDDRPQLRRLPGLYRRWEVAELLKPGEDYRLEDAGHTADGAQLVAIYRYASAEASQ